MRPSDSIGDMLTRIRNACHAKKRFVDVPMSNMKLAIAKLIHEQGFVESIIFDEAKGKQGVIRLFLKYDNQRNPVIYGLKRVSKPGVRQYVGYKSIPTVLGGMGISVLSTSKGIMTGKDAHQQKVGGELLCKIW